LRKWPCREGVAGGLEQAEAGRLHGQRVGVDDGDERAAVDIRVTDIGGVLDGGDSGDPPDHGRGLLGEFCGLAEQGGAVADGKHVGAQAVDLGQQPGLG